MKTLKLFNAVLAKESTEAPLVLESGLVIAANACWDKKRIIEFYQKDKLDGYGLNKTFHKSWFKIKNTSEHILWLEQIQHYVSTYGSRFQDEMHIPKEVLDIPDTKVVFKVIHGLTREELVAKCLDLFKSGIALKEETIHEVLSVLIDELGYTFIGDEEIKNREAQVILADSYNVLPTDTVSFFRYIIYRASGDSLLIKSNEAIEAIMSTDFNPAPLFNQFGLEKLAEIFNRFKPLFLAFKSKCPKTINKISKLSKTHHKPLTMNPLNYVTSVMLTEDDLPWLDNATPFALFKAMAACYARTRGQKAFVYRIRNGKSYVKEGGYKNAVWANYVFLESYLISRFNIVNKSFYVPDNVSYALPTSEKMFIGNIPTGTKFTGKAMAVGVYWENCWGAHDIDLSGLTIAGKVGWNTTNKQDGGNLMYSGDITDAPTGAVEYLYANNGLKTPTLVMSNVFSGQAYCEYKIVIGKGDEINYNYMMNPNNLFAEVKCQSVQKQTVLGMLLPDGAEQSFVVLNFGAGHSRVSGNTKISEIATRALVQQWKNALSLTEVIELLGGKITSNKHEAEYDLSLNTLTMDRLMNVFTENDLKK